MAQAFANVTLLAQRATNALLQVHYVNVTTGQLHHTPRVCTGTFNSKQYGELCAVSIMPMCIFTVLPLASSTTVAIVLIVLSKNIRQLGVR